MNWDKSTCKHYSIPAASVPDGFLKSVTCICNHLRFEVVTQFLLLRPYLKCRISYTKREGISLLQSEDNIIIHLHLSRGLNDSIIKLRNLFSYKNMPLSPIVCTQSLIILSRVTTHQEIIGFIKHVYICAYHGALLVHAFLPEKGKYLNIFKWCCWHGKL